MRKSLLLLVKATITKLAKPDYSARSFLLNSQLDTSNSIKDKRSNFNNSSLSEISFYKDEELHKFDDDSAQMNTIPNSNTYEYNNIYNKPTLIIDILANKAKYFPNELSNKKNSIKNNNELTLPTLNNATDLKLNNKHILNKEIKENNFKQKLVNNKILKPIKQTKNVLVNTITISYSSPLKQVNLKMNNLQRKISQKANTKFQFQQSIRLPPIFLKLNKQKLIHKTNDNNILPNFLKINEIIR
jgi:hypothetical protein